MKRRLTLLRHGKTGFSGKYIGSRDVSLSPEGVSQISSLLPLFQGQDFDCILSSPMERCKESTGILFPGYSHSYDDALREIDFGRWEGLSFSEIEKSDPVLVQQWAAWSPEFCFPEGEQISNFIERVHRVGKKLLTSQDQNIVVIAHGGVIRTLICYLLNLSPENFLLFQVAKGRYATLDLFQEGGVLTGLNLGADVWES